MVIPVTWAAGGRVRAHSESVLLQNEGREQAPRTQPGRRAHKLRPPFLEGTSFPSDPSGLLQPQTGLSLLAPERAGEGLYLICRLLSSIRRGLPPWALRTPDVLLGLWGWRCLCVPRAARALQHLVRCPPSHEGKKHNALHRAAVLCVSLS